jgi:hypothetical protein
MPVMQGKFAPSKQGNENEVIFEHKDIEVKQSNKSQLIQTESQDDLVILEPSSIPVARGKSLPTQGNAAEPPPDPYNLDNYLLTSAEGFSPFEQNLGEAPFHDRNGEPIWAALAYIEDGGIHPAKVFCLYRRLTVGCSSP